MIDDFPLTKIWLKVIFPNLSKLIDMGYAG